MPDMTSGIALCASADLKDGGVAVPFDLLYDGQVCRAFAVRFQGQVHAYLNRCTHVAMEMDFRPNRFFDPAGRWLICATHGAVYQPDTGACAGGPCNGGLTPILLSEAAGMVRWHTDHRAQPFVYFP